MPPQQSSAGKYIAIAAVILIIVGVGVYVLMNRGTGAATADTGNPADQSGFVPYGRAPSTNVSTSTKPLPVEATSTPHTPSKIPTLRLLSNDPVGGYGASTTASTTIVRWIGRGRGNVYEAKGNTLDITTLSNTVVPRIYESIWNNNLTSFIGSTIDGTPAILTTLYAELRARVMPKASIDTNTATSTHTATTTTSTRAVATTTVKQAPGTSVVVDSLQTPYELKGKNLPQNMIGYAISPKSDKIFMLTNEDGYGVGYVATSDGKTVTQIFTTPLTQLNVSWPEDNTIAIATKGIAGQGGYLYFINPKSGAWTKVLGPVAGFSTIVSHDAKYVLYSTGGSNSISTSIYDVAKKTSSDAVVRTLADKCVWGNFYKELVYCAVPGEILAATYPDDWYTGAVKLTDKVWQVNASTGEVHLVSTIVDQSDRIIDAINLGLDKKDDFLFFMNKNDLSLWSFDLVNSSVR